MTAGGVFKSGSKVTNALMRELAKVAPMSELVEPEFLLWQARIFLEFAILGMTLMKT